MDGREISLTVSIAKHGLGSHQTMGRGTSCTLLLHFTSGIKTS